MKAFIALGSNVEPRVRMMLAALHRLNNAGEIRVDAVSFVYQSQAHTLDGSAQGDYLNAVAEVSTELLAQELLERCLAIEDVLGRERQARGKWLPRTIDIDVLLHSAGAINRPGLQIPHPRIADRLFVLKPLKDLLGGDEFLVDLDARLEDLVAACPDNGQIVKTVVNLNNYK